MVNYSNGKVYKIEPINGDDGDVYFGSTTKEYLSQRMDTHRTDYKRWKEEKRNYVSSFSLFEKYGLENCKIILLENINANSKDELISKEAYYIRNFKCVNKVIPDRKISEFLEYYSDIKKIKYQENKENILLKCKKYREENKEKIREKQKENYKRNREHLLEKSKEYSLKNKEKKDEYNKEYQIKNKEKICERRKELYEANKETINEKRKVKVTCECGSICRKDGLREHKKTKKHIDFINIQNSNPI